MSPVQLRAVGRHRRPTTSRVPHLAATAALSGTLVLAGVGPVDAHDVVNASAAAEPSLRYDSSGTAVTVLQQRLGVRSTGWFGPETRAAVRRLQDAKGLTATGVVDRDTWRALNGRGAASRAARNRPDAARASRSGERTSLAELVLAEAARHAGKPYSYGATGPGSFDCSGFTGYVFRRVGVDLPRSSQDQRNAVPRISSENARPGDLMFSHDSSGHVFHVAIYAGDGKIWDSPRTGETVAKRTIWTQRYSFGRPKEYR